jgi:plastocyanin
VRVRRGWAAVLLAGVAGLAGLGPWLTVAAAAASPSPAPVKILDRPGSSGDFDYSPNVVQINVNEKVLWTNKSSTRHTVTSDPGSVSFDSGDLRPDGSWEWRFTAAGVYGYHCTHHPKMVGRVEVVDPDAPTTTSTARATTTTTAPAPTTTTAPATTTTAAPTTTTTTAPRPPAGPVPAPVPSSAAAPPPPTTASSSTTTSAPTTTTTTKPPVTTATSAPPVLAGGAEGGSTSSTAAPAPPSTSAPKPGDTGNKTAAGPPAGPGGELDLVAVALVAALVAVGAFGVWTLIRVRPGRV